MSLGEWVAIYIVGFVLTSLAIGYFDPYAEPPAAVSLALLWPVALVLLGPIFAVYGLVQLGKKLGGNS